MPLVRYARSFAALAILAASLAVATPPAGAAEPALTPAQTKAVEDVVHNYLREHPEVLLEAIQALRDKQAAAEQARQRKALTSNRAELEKDTRSPVAGNPSGDVTIVEFFDYRCTYCKRVSPSLQKLVKSDKNVRFVFKEFPVLGPESVFASRVALAAWHLEPKKYEGLHYALMDARGALTQAKVMDIAASAGYAPDALRAKMSDPEVDQVITRNHQLAQKLGITGTPAFIIGDHLVPGAIDLDTLRALVARARDRNG